MEIIEIEIDLVFTYQIFSFHIDVYDIFAAINLCDKKTFTSIFLFYY